MYIYIYIYMYTYVSAFGSPGGLLLPLPPAESPQSPATSSPANRERERELARYIDR